MLHVTETRITLVNSGDRPMKAFASICLNGEFVVDNFRVVEKDDGEPIVYMPKKSKRNEDGTFKNRNIAYPTNPELRAEIINAIKTAYKKAVAEKNDEDEGEDDEEEDSKTDDESV